MSLAIKYERMEDARMRLKGTVVLYDKVPYYITEITEGTGGEDGPFRVYATPLPTGPAGGAVAKKIAVGTNPDAIRKYISSKHFDIAPFAMGFVNSEKHGLFYCARVPNRQQKQGLCNENVRLTTVTGAPKPFGAFLQSPETVAMVKNEYPSFVRCKALLTDKVPAIAFHRELAIVRDENLEVLTYIYHKNTKVGLVQDNKVVLGKKFLYLKETLAEVGVAVAN